MSQRECLRCGKITIRLYGASLSCQLQKSILCNIIHVRLNVFEEMDLHAVYQGWPTSGPHAACEVILCSPRCNKFVSRFFKFLVFFYRLNYICYQNTPKLYLFFLLWAYHPKTCIANASKICQLFRFGLHPYKLAALRATIGLIYHLMLSHQTY